MTEKEIKSIHPIDLKNRYHFTGLDLRETRAIYHKTKGLTRDWRKGLRNKLHTLIDRLKRLEQENQRSMSANTLASEMRKIQTQVLINADANGLESLEDNEKVYHIHPNYSGKAEFKPKKASKRRQSVMRTIGKNKGGKSLAPRRASVMLNNELLRRANVPDSLSDLPEASNQRNKSSKAPLGLNFDSIPISEDPKPKPNRKKKAMRRLDSSMERDRIKSFYTDGLIHSSSKYMARHEQPQSDSEEEGDNQKDQFDLSGYDVSAIKRESFGTDNKLQSDGERKRQLKKTNLDNEDNFDAEDETDGFDFSKLNAGSEKTRKQSDLFRKIFEMIDSDDIADDDPQFMNQIRKLSNFSSTIDENDDYMLDFIDLDD